MWWNLKIWKRAVIVFGSLALIIALIITGYMIYGNSQLKKLEAIAEKENIPVYYVSLDFLNRAEVKNINPLWKEATILGLHYQDNEQIYVYEGGCKYSILAHELGHHFAIKYYGDRSEAMADIIAKNILK